jgi:hypothetical protein
MKANTLLSSLLFAGLLVRAPAIEQVIIGWDQEWDYMQPMGTNPAVADTDFNTTWFQKASDFSVNYNGPPFGSNPAIVGNPADTTSFDSGTGPGPLGYDVMEYFNAGGEFNAFGTTLTVPNSGVRFAAYFRTNFVAPQLYTAPKIRMLLDDAAMIYYDGTLIARVNQSVSNETYTYLSNDTTATNNETLASANNEAVIQAFSLTQTGTSSTADSMVLVALPTITAGAHTIAVSVRNSANNSSDMGLGLELRGDDSGIQITPAVTNIVRSDNGTATNPADDTVSFTLNVSAVGPVSPAGWKITSPASLSTTTGAYGVAKLITGVPVAEFSGAGHTMAVLIEDAANPTVNATATITTPWCSMLATISNVARQDLGTADPSDDTWSYSVTVTGQFTGTGWTSDNPAFRDGSYGIIQNVSGLSVLVEPNQLTNFTDNADATCTIAFSASAPRIIGTKNFGIEQPLFSDNLGVPANWFVDEALLTQMMNNGGGAPAKVYRSEVINLSAIGAVAFLATLQVDDITTGFEAPDTFNAQLIIDGNAATPVSLIAAYDILTPADGVLTGAELTPAVPGPPPTSGAGNFTFPLSANIPASANSVQLVISGNNDSANETMTVHSILFTTSTDTDGDGLPDTWEIANFGDLSQTAAGDFDQDSASNGNEFAAGTDPSDPFSLLALVSVTPVAGGYNLTWSSVPGKIYRVDFSTDLTTWTDVGTSFPASAGSTTTAFLPVGSPAPRRLYARIRVL